MKSDFVRHVCKISRARLHAPNKFQSLVDVEMRIVGTETQRIDNQHADTAQLIDFTVSDSFEIGKISQSPHTKTHNGEAFGMPALNRNDSDVTDAKRLLPHNFAKLYFWNSPVFVLRKSIIEILTYARGCPRRSINRHPMDRRRIIDEVEGPHIIQTADMVLMLVGQQNGIKMPHATAQHLVTEIGPRVDHQSHAPRLDHGRSPQPPVPRIIGGTDLAPAPDDGHPLRSSGSQKGEFHKTKIRIKNEKQSPTLTKALPDASGCRAGGSGDLYNVGTYGYAWSSSPSSASSVDGSTLVFDSSDVNPESHYNRARGFPVRCVQE